jgi:hypothetical protein
MTKLQMCSSRACQCSPLEPALTMQGTLQQRCQHVWQHGIRNPCWQSLATYMACRLMLTLARVEADRNHWVGARHCVEQMPSHSQLPSTM